ncbi:MYG1 exonuclease [Halyomorpha halys]|uniref:MYG1 exonuclease n=1 Tax=Halyomorpha halys TaxID=286706 RepID=UPI0006D4CA44|nr:UPF0160 protein MYG1, mitochondrial [Halyomorpha halys]
MRLVHCFFQSVKSVSSLSRGHKFHPISMDNIKKIGTHDGTFHCDEVLACYMLRLLSPNADIVRSRSQEVLDTCDVVVDVGGVYNPEKKLFDHHQRDFTISASSLIPGKPWTIKLSSAGLIYCHFGKEIIKKVVENIDETAVDGLFHRIYEGFILEIDAIDNGIPICEGEQRYYISTHLSARVKHLNPSWNQPNADVDCAFHKAMKMVGTEFEAKVNNLYSNWWPARIIVKEAISNRYNLHPTGEIIELSQFCPWTTHLFEIEKEMKLEPTIKHVIFPASLERTVWRVQSVPLEDESFQLRVPLKEQWRGLRDEELSTVSGIEGCIFVHSSGFIGGNHTRLGAIEMARKTLVS